MNWLADRFLITGTDMSESVLKTVDSAITDSPSESDVNRTLWDLFLQLFFAEENERKAIMGPCLSQPTVPLCFDSCVAGSQTVSDAANSHRGLFQVITHRRSGAFKASIRTGSLSL